MDDQSKRRTDRDDDGDGHDGYGDDGYDDGDDDGYDDDRWRSRRRRWIAIAVAVVVVAAIVGVLASRGDDPPPVSFSLAEAARRAADADRLAYDVTITQDGAVVLSAAALLEPTTGSQQVSVDVSPSGAPSFIVDASASSDGGTTGATVYVDAAAFAPIGVQIDATWVRILPDSLGPRAVLDVRALSGRLGGNPIGIADLLVAATPRDLGSETVDGETLQHVQVDLGARDVLAANPGLGTLLRIDVATAPKTFTFDAYVTETNVLRRLTLEVTIGKVVTVVDDTFRTFDGPASVVIPGDADVVDASVVFGS